MCGICGWVDNTQIARETLISMCKALHHRGPDAQQIKIIGNAGFGHARLSIIDLSRAANQPMPNENKSKWIVYNGEFYTFLPYREELLKKGHKFISKTDSEVLLHLYEEDGPNFINKLRGMFAFGIWDDEKKSLMLGRDRVGVKPLYYYHNGKTFLFASELKALLQHPAIERDLDPKAVNYYFTLGYIPKELCIFKNVKKLLPGHYLIYKDGETTINSYWSLPEPETFALKTEKEYVEELLKLLDDSVKMRLISDVPIGVFLSGGVDSSIIATLMAKNSNTPVKTFSIGFEEAKYNELSYARRIAEHIGSEHHEFKVSVDHIEAIEKLAFYYDEPFADSSAIPTYFVSKMAREYVTVVLSGDGGDELFGGYNWYSWVQEQNRFKIIPKFIRKAISTISTLPKGNFKGKHFLKSLKLNEFDTFLERIGFFTGKELFELLPEIHNPDYILEFQAFYESQGTDVLSRLSRTDFHYYLPDDILTKIDRSSMAVSLEARVPMLDHKICEFAYRLPTSLKIKNKKKKYLLKCLAERLLPSDFPLERKQGFSIPLSEWMKEEIGEMCMDLVLSAPGKGNIFNSDYVEKLYKEHKTGYRNHSQKLWAILCFCVWQDQIDNLKNSFF